MHTTLEAIIEVDGQIRTLEPIVLPYPSRALVTILEEEPRTQAHDMAKFLAALAEFPEDFMQNGREQPAMQERENLVSA
jgi:hypothetical protein